MAKAPKIEGKVSTAPVHACEACVFAKQWNDRLYCDFRFPPHVGLDDHPRARIVGAKHWCNVFKHK